ncbi:MAG: N-acetylmuramoyl-L-alanine amidase [Saprospiraceae bacterium]
MSKLLYTLALLIALPLAAIAEPYTFLEVVAENGDGMYALLRRYDLPPNSCNQDAFQSINSLSAKQALRVGKKYKVPVLIYTYNGKSIRSTLGINDLPLAKRIQAYNRSRVKAGQQTAEYEESKALWVPYDYVLCENEAELIAPLAPAEAVLVSSETPLENETAPPIESPEELDKVNTSGYAIFGEKYAKVKREDNELKGKVFFLVSGHGGPDPGAIGKKRDNSLCEDEYAYDVVLRLARNIISHGGVPYVIVRDPDDGIRDDEFLLCDRDEQVWGDLTIPLNNRKRLKQRSDVINKIAKDNKSRGGIEQYCIVIHVDSRHQETQTDLFFYHQKNSDKSSRLTKDMRATVEKNYKRNGRSREYTGAILTRDLHMLREVEVPTVYIELGNIQHSFDQKRVLQSRNRQALANWFTEGIMTSLNR